MTKKVLFAAPSHFGLHQMVIDNLNNAGFEVFSICTDEIFTYKNLNERVINFFRKSFFKDKSYKKKLYYKHLSEEILEKLKPFSNNHFDYSFFIRPDVYSLDIIKRVNSISKKSIAYQWDGLNRFPLVFERIKLFDKFYVFDKDDFDSYKNQYSNLHLTHNFYSDIKVENSNKSLDVFYIGAFDKNRFGNLKTMYNELIKHNLDITIQLNSSDKNVIKQFTNQNITFFSQRKAYSSTQPIIKSAKILLDVKTKDHKGLSFRFFETIKYKCKMITDNVTIKQYDFYHPNNFFILHEDSLNDLEDFINCDYYELSDEILKKYAFKNWIHQIFA